MDVDEPSFMTFWALFLICGPLLQPEYLILVDDTQITTNARHSSRHQAKEAKGERTNDANRPSDDEMTTISTPESDAQALEQCNRKRKEKQKILQYALSVILSQLQGQD